MKNIFEKGLNKKENIFSFLKYKSLKMKEYFGALNQKDFDQLLSFDSQEWLQNNPKIKGVFSPKDELIKIKNLPKEKRGEALTTFKGNLSQQREALAACRVFIERNIEFNHDIPKEKLLELIELFSNQYGFDNEQKEIIERLIDRWIL